MSEIIYPYALTTLERVKTRAKITATDFDIQITRLINQVTDLLERFCNRRFILTNYTNQIYTVKNPRTKILYLKQFPIISISSVDYRAGTPSSPNWTSMTPDEFEKIDDGAWGEIRIYSVAPYGINTLRISYSAGYSIDWANFGSTTHTLPADITDLCERIVIRMLKRLEQDGTTTESLEGSNVTYKEFFGEQERLLLSPHRRLLFV